MVWALVAKAERNGSMPATVLHPLLPSTLPSTTGFLLATVVAVTLLSACEQKTAEMQPPVDQPEVVESEALTAATLAAWDQGSQALQETQQAAQTFIPTIEAFLSSPQKDTLSSARQTWHEVHNRFQGFALFLALSSNNPALFGELETLSSPIDSWPIQPGYLDYFDVYTHSGIVNDIAVPITAAAIRRQHGFSDATDVSLGLHAIAYLLWGEQGKRAESDYTPVREINQSQAAAGISVMDLPNNRRRTLLTLLCSLLVDDLKQINLHWSHTNSSLQQHYLALIPHSRLRLLQAATVQFLTHNLVAMQITALMHNTDEEALHNRFAGGHGAAINAGLEALEQLLFAPESDLSRWINNDSRDDLLLQLNTARKILEKSSDPWKDKDKQLPTLHGALTAMADLLRPKELNTQSDQSPTEKSEPLAQSP